MKKQLLPLCISLVLGLKIQAQSIATFNSVTPSAQTSNFVLPATHTFQKIIQTGNSLTMGGTMGENTDFTGYVPISGSSTNGYLSISSETVIAECAILSITFNPLTKLWNTTSSGKVDLPLADIGLTANFCSGTVTPNNTIMVGEEVTYELDVNADGYSDVGWIIEIDPATRTVINQDGVGGMDKLWAMGNQAHENVTIKQDQSVAYWGADNTANGFLYKFVPSIAGKYNEGTLYVLETSGSGNGTWKVIANTSKTERNNTLPASIAASAHNFNRIEDVEIGPDGKIYFASTTTGVVYRFTDNGTTISNLETFINNSTFTVEGVPVKFEWPDNLAFDGEGNLWVLQDGGDNHIWVFGPNHTAANPNVKIFANTPFGCEPTGITFSPDHKFIFLSLQHPSGNNTVPQNDAAGNEVIFNTHTTLVIARKENLGIGAVLPLRFINLEAKPNKDNVKITWKTDGNEQAKSYTIERSADGVRFTPLTTIDAVTNNNFLYQYTDDQLPFFKKVFYRIKACYANSNCLYSDVKSAKIAGAISMFQLFPQPANDYVYIKFNTAITQNVSINLLNSAGKKLHTTTKSNVGNQQQIAIPTKGLAKGMYVISITAGNTSITKSFIKQ